MVELGSPIYGTFTSIDNRGCIFELNISWAIQNERESTQDTRGCRCNAVCLSFQCITVLSVMTISDAIYHNFPKLGTTGAFSTLAHLPTSTCVLAAVPPHQAGLLLPQRVYPRQPSAGLIHHGTRATQLGTTTAKEADSRERERGCDSVSC